MGLALPLGLLAVNVVVVTAYTAGYAYGHGSYSFWVSTAVASIPGCWALYLLYLWIAAAKLATARRLASLHITIDTSGVTVGQHLHPWKWIRHIVLTPARTPDKRTLLVDAHTSSEATPKDATRSGRIRRRRILGTRKFTVELPLNAVDAAPAELLRAVGHHCNGRLPDTPHQLQQGIGRSTQPGHPANRSRRPPPPQPLRLPPMTRGDHRGSPRQALPPRQPTCRTPPPCRR